MRHETPRHVVPFERVFRGPEKLSLHRGVTHDIEKLLMAPDVILERRDVQIADEGNGIAFLAAMPGEAGFHLAEEVELMGEFGIPRRVGNVAAGWHVEIVQLQSRLEMRRDMAGIVLAAKGERTGLAKRQSREDGNPVIALLAVDRLMDITERVERIRREELIPDLGFLEAKHVGGVVFEELAGQLGAKADRIDVPGGEFNGSHGPLLFP